MGLHHLSTEFMDYDAAGQAAFRRWLREQRGLDLSALGRRWYGDPARFKSWAQVSLPSNYEFFGAFGDGTLDLRADWRWRPDRAGAEDEGWAKVGYQPGDDWTPTDLAPSQRQLLLFGSRRDKELRTGHSTTAWFRKPFDPSAWLAASPGQPSYLVAQVGDTQTQPVEVWLNDAYLGLLEPKTVWCGPIAFNATTLLRPGDNVLCLKVRGGLIRGPVFLLPGNPLLPHFGGLSFNGNGIAVNWMGVNHLSEGSVALQPRDGDGTVLARWEDGTAAVGLRQLGKGRVLVLGSSFWRSMSDRAGRGVSLNGSVQTRFFDDLFAALGLHRQATIDSEDVWTRRLLTKNGLEDWRADLGWLTEPTAGWREVGYGFWDDQGLPAKGVGLYRADFAAPATWAGRRVLLTCASWDFPVFLERATFYLNGRRVGEYQGHPWANFDSVDITAALQPGDNSLAALVETY